MLTKQNRIAFRNILERSTIDRTDDTVVCLEDAEWRSGELRMSELPTTLPTAIRTQVRALLNVQREVNRALDELQNELLEEAEAVLAAKDAAEELAKPHCDKCGQVIKPKKRTTRR